VPRGHALHLQPSPAYDTSPTCRSTRRRLCGDTVAAPAGTPY